MPYHQLVLELPRGELARAEDACAELGAIALSLADAGDEPLLEPAPGDTPLWQAVRLQALFGLDANPAVAAATLAAVLEIEPASIAIQHVEDRVWEREWLKDLRPMRFGRRGRQPSCLNSTPASPSAQARMRRPRSAWNGWTGRFAVASRSSTMAADRESSRLRR
jgi:hypothetical protein